MQKSAMITLENNQLFVSGEINFATAMPLWRQSQALLSQCPAWHFDFSGVTSCNSSALSLMIEWKKLATKQSKTIFFHALPQQLISVMTMASITL